MIQIRFEEREKIGLQYILESLHGCSPFGQERIRRLRYYTPDGGAGAGAAQRGAGRRPCGGAEGPV